MVFIFEYLIFSLWLKTYFIVVFLILDCSILQRTHYYVIQIFYFYWRAIFILILFSKVFLNNRTRPEISKSGLQISETDPKHKVLERILYLYTSIPKNLKYPIRPLTGIWTPTPNSSSGQHHFLWCSPVTFAPGFESILTPPYGCENLESAESYISSQLHLVLCVTLALFSPISCHSAKPLADPHSILSTSNW